MFFPDAAADAVRLLRSLNVQVDFPADQTCCGQPAYNAGHADLALRMGVQARHVFRGHPHVVLPSGSCATMVRHFTPRLLGERGREDRGGAAQRTQVAGPAEPRYWELTELLVHGLGVSRLGDGLRGLKVAYHHGCHALRELGVRDEPLMLLAEAGAELVPWEASQECCGFGGLFSVKFPEVSAAMADRKLDTMPGVDVLTSADAGCLLQLSGRLEKRGMRVPVIPLASLLWRARMGGEKGHHDATGADERVRTGATGGDA